MGFDAVQSAFAYVAGGAVVVVDVDSQKFNQRFYRARPTAVPVYATPNLPYSPSTPNPTLKANDSRNRAPIPARDSSLGAFDWNESPSRTWTSRERIKAATCLALSKDARFLAVGETGYAPRVLIFSLEDSSSDKPLVSISEHLYGVKAVAWSADSKFLASLGEANDGFLYLWKIDTRTGAANLFQQNRCTSFVRGLVWMDKTLITFGVRHVKAWRVDEANTASAKQRFVGEINSSSQPQQKSLPGRNVLLGNMVEATFSCAAIIDQTRAIICSEMGDVCLLDDKTGQVKLTKVLEIGFVTRCVAIRDQTAHIGGKSGSFATLDLRKFCSCDPDCIIETTESSPATGLLALGFLERNLVTVDAKRSIDIWNSSYIPGRQNTEISHDQMPGHGDAILGVEVLPQPNDSGAGFYTWSKTGRIMLWDMNGTVIKSFRVALEEASSDEDVANELTIVKATKGAKFFVTGDKLGILKIKEFASMTCVLETKAHALDCQSIMIYEDDSKFLIASSARDRTVQLFHRNTAGNFEHFQTLEFVSKVQQILIPSSERIITSALDRSIQIHDLVTKEGDLDAMAAIPARSFTLKSSPASMAMASDGKSVFISCADRSVLVCNTDTCKQVSAFKCTDEGGVESVVLDSLVYRPATETAPSFLLGLSNTDKSIRLYDTQRGRFLDREWGHTEAINGITLVEQADGKKKVVSAGSDGTIMIWDLEFEQPSGGSREPSPVKDASTSARPPLRRVLSTAELAEFRPPSRRASSSGRRSPPRTLPKRRSLRNISSMYHRSPVSAVSPASTIAEKTPSRRPSICNRSGSPPHSPKARVPKQTSSHTLNKPKSSSNLRAFGSLNMATEQTCRTLRAYRKKLESSEHVDSDVLGELDQELRMTSLVLGDRAKHHKVVDSMLNGILNQYSSRLIEMLEEKMRLHSQSPETEKDLDSPSEKRPDSSSCGSL